MAVSESSEAAQVESGKARNLPIIRRFIDDRGQKWVETRQPVVPGRFGKVKFIKRVVADPDAKQPKLKHTGFKASRPLEQRENL